MSLAWMFSGAAITAFALHAVELSMVLCLGALVCVYAGMPDEKARDARRRNHVR